MTALKIMMLSAATVVLGGSSLLATERTGDACTLVEFTAASCPSSDMTAYCGQIGPSRGCPATASAGSCTQVTDDDWLIRCEYEAP